MLLTLGCRWLQMLNHPASPLYLYVSVVIINYVEQLTKFNSYVYAWLLYGTSKTANKNIYRLRVDNYVVDSMVHRSVLHWSLLLLVRDTMVVALADRCLCRSPPLSLATAALSHRLSSLESVAVTAQAVTCGPFRLMCNAPLDEGVFPNALKLELIQPTMVWNSVFFKCVDRLSHCLLTDGF